ncbi:MAG: imidazole glycerol phosphate synthase cyclase subunit [Myxococcaceae bacterium]|nr:imidazole glycerol phosphate synthase cyclase subunit [Myxococcaceae bacterium]
MTAKRLIARLDIKGPNVVRGIHLEGLRVVGQPEEMAARYAEAGIDELIFIDTVATLYGRNNTLAVVERTAEKVFVPLTVGGGIRELKDVDAVLRAGADKVSVNSAAVRRPEFVTEIAKSFGSQCVVATIEAKRQGPAWTVVIENAREATGKDVLQWAKEVVERGAGEICLTSIDEDGMKRGCDLALVRAVSQAVRVPVIASGGPGKPEHAVDALQAGADAVALGTLLHFKLATVADVKQAMSRAGVETRAR